MRRLVLVAISTVLLLPAAVSAQEVPEVRVLQVDEVDVESHPDVSVTVTAPRELVGLDLDAGSFQLFEDFQGRDITVAKLPNDALEVLLLLDTSGSMADAWSAAQAAALGFVEQMPATTRIGVMGFGTEPVVATEFTTDADAITAAVQSLSPRGETALYDALLVALQQFSTGDDVRRTLVLLSDGGDTVSVTNVIDAVSSLAGADINFSAIELESFENDSAVLAQLAEAGGGSVVPAVDSTALAGIYERIASDLVNQYRIEFESDAFGDTRLQIAMEAGGIAALADETFKFPLAPAPPTTILDPAPPPETVRSPQLIEIPPLREGTVVTTGWLQSDNALRVGVVASFVAAVLAFAYLLFPRPRAAQLTNRDRLQSRVRRPETTTALGGLANSISALAERFIHRQGKRKTLELALERAGIMLRPGEFLVFAGGIVFAALAIGTTIRNFLLGIALAGLTTMIIAVYVQNRQKKRVNAFADQLVETLQLMAGTLRAGYGLIQAVDTVAREAPSPTGDEFRRLVAEVRLGRDLNEALHALGERVGNEDFVWVIGAIEIQQEVGGDLAEVLDTVASTIRDRNQIKRHVRALSADGRMSATILIPLPFVVGFIIAGVAPDYIAELFTTVPGRVMVILGFILMGMGTYWMSKVVKVEF